MKKIEGLRRTVTDQARGTHVADDEERVPLMAAPANAEEDDEEIDLPPLNANDTKARAQSNLADVATLIPESDDWR